MADVINTSITDINGTISNFKVGSQSLDVASSTGETYWDSAKWNEYLGYYKEIPELKSAIDSLIQWVIGRGYEAPHIKTKLRLQKLRGWGEDSFLSIMQNMLIMKLINGDAFSEIIRNDAGELINLKPLDPSSIRTVVNEKGVIKRYEETRDKKVVQTFKPSEILHFVNDRIGSEIHGVSKIESVKWLIDTRNEIMNDLRRLMHRSTIRVLYVEIDDRNRHNQIKSQYQTALDKGELIILPVRKGEADFEDLSVPPVQVYLEFVRYIENAFYKAIGVPEVILGGSGQFSEASAKTGMMTFDQPYITEQRRVEEDLRAQLGIEIKFERAPSLTDELQRTEQQNSSQTGIQPKDSEVTLGRE